MLGGNPVHASGDGFGGGGEIYALGRRRGKGSRLSGRGGRWRRRRCRSRWRWCGGRCGAPRCGRRRCGASLGSRRWRPRSRSARRTATPRGRAAWWGHHNGRCLRWRRFAGPLFFPGALPIVLCPPSPLLLQIGDDGGGAERRRKRDNSRRIRRQRLHHLFFYFIELYICIGSYHRTSTHNIYVCRF